MEYAQNDLDKFRGGIVVLQLAFDFAQYTSLRWLSGVEASEIEVRKTIIILWDRLALYKLFCVLSYVKFLIDDAVKDVSLMI